MARILPSLQLAKTLNHSYTLHLTPYTLHLTPYTSHLTSYTLQIVREFFCIEHSSRGTILCRLASRASSLGWLVGNKSMESSGGKLYWWWFYFFQAGKNRSKYLNYNTRGCFRSRWKRGNQNHRKWMLIFKRLIFLETKVNSNKVFDQESLKPA